MMQLKSKETKKKGMLGWIALFGLISAVIAYYWSWRAKKSFRGKTVLITGGGSGLGRLLSHKFAEEGARIVIWDIRDELMQQTETELKARHKDVFVRTYVVDLSNREMIYEVADRVKQEIGDVQVVVNNAGIVSGSKFLDCTDKQIELTMKVNAMAHMWILKAFLPTMIKKNDGHIITIASASGLTGVNGLADYAASKFAAVGFDESIRLELRKIRATGVHTTVVCPFYINTGMFEGVKSSPILPVLDQHYVVAQIMRAAKAEKAILYLPGTVGLAPFLKSVLPTSFVDRIGELLGVSSTMDEFKGRGSGWSSLTLENKKAQ